MMHRLVTRRSALAVAVLASIAPGDRPSADDPLARLFQSLVHNAERHARFNERKFFSFVKGAGRIERHIDLSRHRLFLESAPLSRSVKTVRIEGIVVNYEGVCSG